MKKWLLKVVDGRPTTTSAHQKADFKAWLGENEGKILEVVPRERISKGKRGYFEGAIVPTYCDWHDALDPRNPEHRALVREELKTEFNGVTLKGISGKPHKVAQSTTGLSNDQFGQFLERITRYFEENQIPIPDPELYKRWQDMFMFDYPDYWEWLQATNQHADGSPIQV